MNLPCREQSCKPLQPIYPAWSALWSWMKRRGVAACWYRWRRNWCWQLPIGLALRAFRVKIAPENLNYKLSALFSTDDCWSIGFISKLSALHRKCLFRLLEELFAAHHEEALETVTYIGPVGWLSATLMCRRSTAANGWTASQTDSWSFIKLDRDFELN